MTVGDWLGARQPSAPARLAARIEAAVAIEKSEPASRAAEVCLDACERLLADVASRPSPGRESALDLLAANALATYALEAAAETPASLENHARDALRRLAALATE